MSDNRKVMLVANPVSGKKAVANALSDICRVFLELGWIPSVFVTGGRGDATDYVKKYGGDFGRIVAIGGDGTMNETVTGIIEAGLDTPFAFIPSGTTNDFASTHHLPTDIEYDHEEHGSDHCSGRYPELSGYKTAGRPYRDRDEKHSEIVHFLSLEEEPGIRSPSAG